MVHERYYRIARGVMFGLCVIIAALQLVKGPRRTNPRVEPSETLQANLTVPAPVAETLRRACANCHSNETAWPWYSKIAPFSWMMARDVEKARRSMNLSRWSIQNGRRPEVAIATLQAACSGLRL